MRFITMGRTDPGQPERSTAPPCPHRRRGGKIVVLLLFALVVLAVLAVRYLRTSQAVNPVNGPPLKPSLADEFRGVSIQFWSGSSKHPYEKYIREISRTGANTICFVPHGYQENASSTSVFHDSRHTPTDERFAELIRFARKQKLRVMLMPIVLLENPREDEWRGKIRPTDWKHWWTSYTNFILRYAHLCEKAGADVLIVGSELLYTEEKEKQWRNLISQMRKVYRGRVSYSANWDHYRQIRWWDAVDIVGLTTYYDLTDDGRKKPTLENLQAEWKDIRTKILTWQRKVNRPILFTEVGWPSQVTAAKEPWNYYGSEDSPDHDLQARCFEAFFRTWYDQEAMVGYLVWEWPNNSTMELTDPDKLKKDVGYVPCGKPAMDVIRKYNAKPAIRRRRATTQPFRKRQLKSR
ncbi:MAG: glycoside hydrolase family 113 [Phycisphaerae bacterium]